MSIVLNRLLDADKNIKIVKTNVSQPVVNILKRLRRVDVRKKKSQSEKKQNQEKVFL